MSPRLEIYVNKKRTLALIGLTCVMVAISYVCTRLPGLLPRLVGWVGVGFFSLAFLVLPRQLFRAGPQLVIDERGLEDRRSKLGRIDWADIVLLSVVEVRGQKFLSIQVVEPKKYLDRLSTPGRISAQANRSFGFSEISIGFSGLSHSAVEVLNFIQEHYAGGRILSAGVEPE